MIPRFAHARPGSLVEAFAAFDAAGGDAAWYAGGTELLQVMKMGLARFGTLVDLKRIPELGGISRDEAGGLVIGGTVTHREIERSAVVRAAEPALAALAAQVANPRVRNQGTLGGNLCFAEPHSDPATFLLAAGARLDLRGPSGRREVAIDEFLVGPFATTRAADEILAAVVVPAAGAGEGRAYEKIVFRERPAVSVAVGVRVADGAIVEARVVVGSMTDVPAVVADAGAALAGSPADGETAETSLAAAVDALARLPAEDDLDGSADYKRHLAGVLLRRAVRAAVSEAVAGA
ncbi:MAG TPA: FAD binding domain-containing protein [Candidatus Limnocylindrales bacterium]|nr:FAD binding domain-containing protein [Candidatus Limnocylindrales bacterium]